MLLLLNADIFDIFKQQSSMQQKSGPSNAAANVKVVCRFRPLNERQKALGATHCHQLLDDKTIQIKDRQVKDNKEPLKFSFDKVFDTSATQEQVYTYSAGSIIDSIIEGFNGTIFAYGQTASGKTHTMEGDIGQSLSEQSGIIPRMVKHVFSSIAKSMENIQFRIKVSLTELYMQKLRDLLDQNKIDLKIRSDKKRGVFIEDITQKYISSPDEVYQLIQIARNSRAIASTNMNERSSRSHMIFILTVSQDNTADLSAKTGKLYLVDLAGSQKIAKTGAEGKTLDEAKKINASLTTLGKVINSLTDGKSTHIPYRQSKLTRVLQESLGGNSKTSLIVTCSPHPNNIAQTISSLRFGISAKKIKNTPKINKEMTVPELLTLLDRAEKQIQAKDKYLQFLKNHIMTDLKQKSIPEFQNDKNVQAIDQNQNDYLAQLQRQLQMQKNLHLVQQQQINSLKTKCDQMSNQKDELEKEMQNIRFQLTLKSKQLKDMHVKVTSQTIEESSSNKLTTDELLKELEKITDDDRVLTFISSQAQLKLKKNEDHEKLLNDYESEKEKRKKAEDNLAKYQKNMQKKLVQLENNICQLTHAYYDLVVVQQRYKVDNIFLKKNLEEKDIMVRIQKEKIKELEDQNRELEQYNEEDRGEERIPRNLKMGVEESLRKFDQMKDKKGTSPHQPNIVKVIKGGAK